MVIDNHSFRAVAYHVAISNETGSLIYDATGNVEPRQTAWLPLKIHLQAQPYHAEVVINGNRTNLDFVADDQVRTIAVDILPEGRATITIIRAER